MLDHRYPLRALSISNDLPRGKVERDRRRLEVKESKIKKEEKENDLSEN